MAVQNRICRHDDYLFSPRCRVSEMGSESDAPPLSFHSLGDDDDPIRTCPRSNFLLSSLPPNKHDFASRMRFKLNFVSVQCACSSGVCLPHADGTAAAHSLAGTRAASQPARTNPTAIPNAPHCLDLSPASVEPLYRLPSHLSIKLHPGAGSPSARAPTGRKANVARRARRRLPCRRLHSLTPKPTSNVAVAVGFLAVWQHRGRLANERATRPRQLPHCVVECVVWVSWACGCVVVGFPGGAAMLRRVGQVAAMGRRLCEIDACQSLRRRRPSVEKTRFLPFPATRRRRQGHRMHRTSERGGGALITHRSTNPSIPSRKTASACARFSKTLWTPTTLIEPLRLQSTKATANET